MPHRFNSAYAFVVLSLRAMTTSYFLHRLIEEA